MRVTVTVHSNAPEGLFQQSVLNNKCMIQWLRVEAVHNDFCLKHKVAPSVV